MVLVTICVVFYFAVANLFRHQAAEGARIACLVSVPLSVLALVVWYLLCFRVMKNVHCLSKEAVYSYGASRISGCSNNPRVITWDEYNELKQRG